MQEVQLPYASLRFIDPIVIIRYKGGTELGFPEIKELTRKAELLSNGKPYLTIADVRGGINITHEGKKYATDLSRMPLFRGTAVIVSNEILSFAANFMNDLISKKYPYKVFTSEEKAMDWLLALSVKVL